MSCCRISTKICAEHCNKIFGEEITLDVFISVMGSKYMILMLHEEKGTANELTVFVWFRVARETNWQSNTF